MLLLAEIVYVVVALVCWPMFTKLLIDDAVGPRTPHPHDVAFGLVLGFVAAALWPVSLPLVALYRYVIIPLHKWYVDRYY